MASITVFEFLMIGGTQQDPDYILIGPDDSGLLIGRTTYDVYDDAILPSVDLDTFFEAFMEARTLMESRMDLGTEVEVFSENETEMDLKVELDTDFDGTGEVK